MEETGKNDSLAEQKRLLRSVARSERDAIPPDLRQIWSGQACKAVIEWLQNRERQARSVMVYMPFRSELNTRELIEWGWESGLLVILPRCRREDRSMDLHIIRGWEDLSAGAYGIPEPDPLRAPLCERSVVPDLVCVPGLAFDPLGGRLGYGGGYYDRFRQRLAGIAAAAGAAMPPWVGFGFESQVHSSVPLDAHDVQMDALTTENGVRTFNLPESIK